MQKLQEQKLELPVDQLPTEFSFDDKGHMVLLLAGWDNVSTKGKALTWWCGITFWVMVALSKGYLLCLTPMIK
jgi:hypothetical protein